jgi:hypothetical protein
VAFLFGIASLTFLSESVIEPSLQREMFDKAADYGSIRTLKKFDKHAFRWSKRRGNAEMPTRSRTTWKPRSDGQYDCRVGWKINRSGNRDQHRFRLGTDPKEAKRRDHLLRQIWEKIEQASSSDPTWSDETMELAALVARGITHLHLPRRSDEDVVS